MGLRASGVAKRAIRQNVYEKLLRLGPAYAKSMPTNEAVQISTEGVEQLEVYFGSYLPQFFYAVLAPLTLFACLAPLSLVVAVILLVCVPLIPASIVAVQCIAKRVMRDYWGHYTDLGGTFLENIQGLTTLKIYQADAARHVAMNDEAESFRQATMRLLRMQLNSITVMDLLAFGGAALGIVVTLVQFSNGLVSFAGAFTIVFLSAEFFIPMRSLGSLFHTAMNGMAAADVLLLDEPTTFLDIRYQLDLLELMCQLNREAGITVIMVLHDINQAIRYSDEVVALADGTVAAQGDPREVITSELLERVYGIALQVVYIQGNPHVLTTRTEDAARRDKVNSAGGDRDPKVESSECTRQHAPPLFVPPMVRRNRPNAPLGT